MEPIHRVIPDTVDSALELDWGPPSFWYPSSSLGVWSEFLRLSPLTENKEIWSTRVCFLAVVELVGSVSPLPSWCRRSRTRCDVYKDEWSDPRLWRSERAPGRSGFAAGLSLDRDTSSLGDKGTRAATFADCLALSSSQFQKRLCLSLSPSLYLAA